MANKQHSEWQALYIRLLGRDITPKTADEQKQENLARLEAKYRDLIPLPEPLPYPAYWPEEKTEPAYQTDGESCGFYEACAGGDLSGCQSFVLFHEPDAATLALGLEKAMHALHRDVVYFLLRKAGAQLHFRCFRRNASHPSDLVGKEGSVDYRIKPQALLATDRPELFDLLKMLIEEGFYHPNQLLGPLQIGHRPWFHPSEQEVALHYPRCLGDHRILELLLHAGADATIARELRGAFSKPDPDLPTKRLNGHILQSAVNLVTPAMLNMIIEHGADLKYANGKLFHSLARHTADRRRFLNDEYMTPEAPFPMAWGPRREMAEHLLALGEDINAHRNIYRMVCFHVTVCCPPHWEATPLLHAVLCQDWEYVRWLLEHGADPSGVSEAAIDSNGKGMYGNRPNEVKPRYHAILDQVKQDMIRGSLE